MFISSMAWSLFRFLDSALRAPLEMTGVESPLEMTGGTVARNDRFLDSALLKHYLAKLSSKLI